MSNISSEHRVVFLFGAGASIPANCKSTPNITKCLINEAIKKNSYLSDQHAWIETLWEFIKLSSRDFHDTDTTTLPDGRVFNHKRFEPNFEHLIFLIELLEDYMDTPISIRSDQRSYDLINSLGLSNNPEGYPALLYSFKRLFSDLRSISPLFTIKGASAKYMWANKAILKLISDQFLKKYDISFLAPFQNIFKDPTLKVTIATINYDLVFDQFFYDNSINFQDGFSKNKDLSIWESFNMETEDVLYLKLHGSLNWFQIEKNWFSEKPMLQSPNQIYKIHSLDILPLLKKKYRERYKINEKYRYEINSPQLIIGGLKEIKTLDSPFIEIHHQWQYELLLANTLVIIGMSGSDKHILRHIRGLLLTNKNLDKIIIINRNESALLTFYDFFKNFKNILFPYQIEWDINSIQNDMKLPFEIFIKMPSHKLKNHYFPSRKVNIL